MNAFEKAFEDIKYVHPKRTYGQVIEDRESQITFSALGQQSPLELKKVWDPTWKKRLRLKAALERYIPEFEIRLGGMSSIDVTEKGIDKAYGIKKIEKELRIPLSLMLFVGDALFEGGNDYPVRRTGVDCIEVSGPDETKKVIKELILDSVP